MEGWKRGRVEEVEGCMGGGLYGWKDCHLFCLNCRGCRGRGRGLDQLYRWAGLFSQSSGALHLLYGEVQ